MHRTRRRKKLRNCQAFKGNAGARPKRVRPLGLERLEARALLAAFTEGNVVVYRVGDGASTLENTGNAVFLDEFTPDGTLVQSLPMPTVLNGNQQPLIAAGRAETEGLITRSADGRFLMLTGYGQPLGETRVLPSSAPTTVRRVIGRVDANGAIDTHTPLTGDLVKGSPRSAVSTDGFDIWYAGGDTTPSGPVQVTSFGSTSTTDISLTVNNNRQLQIFDGQLYVSTSTGTSVRIGKVGVGLPRDKGQTIVNLPGIPSSANPYGFFLADLSPSEPGVDTLYIADEGAAAISKYTLNGGVWLLNGTIGQDSDNYRGLTGFVSGSTVTLYATRLGGNDANGGGELVSIVDASGFAANLTAAPTLLATAAVNTAFRGVALAPVNPNGPPTISDIADLQIAEDAPASLDFTVGDAETPLDALQVTASSSNETLVATASLVLSGSGANRTLSFQPAANLAGSTTITLTVTDAGGKTASDSFVLTVTAENDAPTITSIDDQTIDEDGSLLNLEFTVGDVETSTGALTIAVASDNTALVPLSGITVSGTGASRTVSVVPAGDQFGEATITLTVDDGDGGAANETFLVTVNPVNDKPTITPPANQTIDEDASLLALPFTIGDVETSASMLTVTAASSNTVLLPLSGITLGGAGANRTISLIPSANVAGTSTITLTVADEDGAIATASFELIVNAVNDAPTIDPLDDVATSEDVPIENLPLMIGDLETPADSLVVSFSSDNVALVPLAGIALSGTGANRTLSITPAANQSGTATITVTVADTDGGATDATFIVTVNPVNDAPLIDAIADQVTNEDIAIVALPFAVSDVETDASALVLSVDSNNLSLVPLDHILLQGSAANRSITIAPVTNLSGSATITITVEDGSGEVATTEFLVTVLAENDLPAIDPIPSQTTAEDTPVVDIPFTFSDVETPADGLTVSVASSNEGLIPSANIQVDVSGGNGTISLTPSANQSGSATITVTISDTDGGSASETFAVQVLAVNDRPVADSLATEISSDSILSGALSGSDVEGATLTYHIVGLPRRGVLTLIDPWTGQFQYRPRPGLHGPDRFTFLVSDGSQKSELAVVEVVVQEVVGDVRLDNGALQIVATSHSDLIVLRQDGDGKTRVQMGSRSFGPFDPPTRISVQAGAGDDIVVAAGFTIPIDMTGDAGNDLLVGSDGNDSLLGGDGHDRLFGHGGDDFLRGGQGTDFIWAGLGDDRLYGEEGNDDLHGGQGSDIVVGGNGHDHLDGGGQDDLLIGGLGVDVVHGGDGDDLVAGNYTDDDAVALAGDVHELALQMILAQWRAARPTGLLDGSLQEDHAADELFGDEGTDEVIATENDLLGN